MAKKPTLDRDAVVSEARKRYEQAKEFWGPIYEKCRDDMRFSDPTNPRQWPDAARKERESAEGGARPCLTFDQTSQFVRQVVNTARRNRPAINYLPVDDDSDPKQAEVLKGLARQTEYASRADVAYITSLNHAVRGGIGWFRLVLEDEPGSKIEGQKCARIRRVVDFETVLVDPNFTEPDGSDMAWGFVETYMPREQFEREYPDANASATDDAGWFTKDAVRICEYYRVVETEDGKAVEHFKISGEEILKCKGEPEKSIFPAEHVPLFPVLGNEEWEGGKRSLSGCIRLARDAQVTYNFERNAAYEAVAVGPKAPWIAAAEAVEGHEPQWRQANRGNLAFLPWNHIDDQGNPIPPPQRVNPAGIAVGWADLAERSKNDIQSAMGQFEASSGNNPNNQSGRAVIALQDRADVGSYHYVDNLALTISHCGRVLTQVWPVIYDQKQVVRIIGEDDKPDFVTVDPSMKAGYAEVKGLDGESKVIINPNVGKFDVRATVGPSFQTRQQEAAADLAEMVNGNPQMLALLGDMLVKVRNYPDADKLARRFKALLPPQVQQAEAQDEEQQQIPPQVLMQMQQMQEQMQQMGQALQEAQSGMAVKQMELQSRERIELARLQSQERIAAMNADNRMDTTELGGLIDLLKVKIQPPPELTQAVNEDFTEENS